MSAASPHGFSYCHIMISKILVNATIEQVYAVLTDYEGYADWAPDVVSATVLAKEGDIVVAEFYSPELMDDPYQLEFVHSKPVSIIYKQKGIFEKTGRSERGLTGTWSVANAPDNQGVRVTGVMRLQGPFRHSFTNKKIVSLILQRRLDVIQHMFDHLQPEQDLDILPQGMGREILDGLSGGETQEIWLYGSKFSLTRTDRI